jgi:hypothetical protein
MLRRVGTLQHVLALLAQMDLRYQQRFDAQGQALEAALLSAKEAVQTALTAAEKAVVKAETATEKRFESVNEFRATLSDQAASFPSRVELRALADTVSILRDEVTALRSETRGSTATRSTLFAVGGLIVAVISTAVIVLSFLLR